MMILVMSRWIAKRVDFPAALLQQLGAVPRQIAPVPLACNKP
jgi:hypothetical protein